MVTISASPAQLPTPELNFPAAGKRGPTRTGIHGFRSALIRTIRGGLEFEFIFIIVQ